MGIPVSAILHIRRPVVSPFSMYIEETFSDHCTSVNRSVDMAVLYDFPLRLSAIKVYYIVGVVVAQSAMAGVEIVMMVRGSSHV